MNASPEKKERRLKMQNSQHLPVGYKIQNRYEVLEIPHKEDNVLGQGGFGIVYLVADTKRQNRLFVIKELFLLNYSFRHKKDGLTIKTNSKREAKETFAKVKEDVVKEIDTLSTIDNKNIVKAYGHVRENNTIYSILEYIDGSNIDEYIGETSFSEDEAIELLRQMIFGLKEIHKKNIIHRDIKPSNIMRTDDGIYKIIDFTTSKTYSTNKTTITGVISKGYSPPELERTQAIIGDYSDIYSIGMTLYNVLSLKNPPLTADRYGDDNFFQDIDSLNISDRLKNIIKKMTAMEIKDRFQNLKEVEYELDRKEPLSPPYLLWSMIFIATIVVGYLSYYLYDILTKSTKKKDRVPKEVISVTYTPTPNLQEKKPLRVESNYTIDNIESPKEPIKIKEEPKIKLINDIKFDKSKMINNLQDRDILTLTKDSISFSFEADRLISSKPKSFYNNKLIWKLKNSKYQIGQNITKKLKIQQFAKKIILGVHGDMVHLVITLKDGYSFDSTEQSGYEIITFYKKREGR